MMGEAPLCKLAHFGCSLACLPFVPHSAGFQLRASGLAWNALFSFPPLVPSSGFSQVSLSLTGLPRFSLTFILFFFFLHETYHRLKLS